MSEMKAAGQIPPGQTHISSMQATEKAPEIPAGATPCEICGKRQEGQAGTGVCWICWGDILTARIIARTERGLAELKNIIQEAEKHGGIDDRNDGGGDFTADHFRPETD